MVCHYKLLLYIFFLSKSFLKVFCNEKDSNKFINPPPEFEPIPNFPYENENQGPPNMDKDPRDKPWPDERENIIMKLEQLLTKEKDLRKIYDSESLKNKERINQLRISEIYLTLLIIVACLLFILIIIYSCYEFYKYRKKKKINNFEEPLNKIYSFGKEFKSSFGSSSSLNNSTSDSNKKNSFSAHSQNENEDLNNSSNFNILIKSNKIENKLDEKKEEEFTNRNYNDEDEAPIQYYENKNNNNFNNNIINKKNNNNNVYNDDEKTLTNDENVYFASRTDKLLYKPYSNEEINNK